MSAATVTDPAHHCNAGQLLLDRFLSHGGRPALLGTDARCSYRELATLSMQAGSALRAAGIGASDRVLICLEDSIELVALMIGSLTIGAVAVAVNPRITDAELAFFIDDSECSALVASRIATDPSRPVGASRSALRFSVGSADDRRRDSVLSFIRAGAATLDAAPTRSGDDALWQYTSGSTGQPKAAVHTHAGVAALADYPRERLQMSTDDTVMAVGKLFTSMGAFMLMNALHAGASYCTLEGPVSPLAMAGAIQQFRPSVYCGLPSNYAAMLALPLADFRSLRSCVVGGERLTRTLADAWRARTGLEFINALASTEIGGPGLLSRPGSGDPTRLETVPGYLARLIDEAGQMPVAAGEPGELLVKGPTMFARYWNSEARTREVLVDGWIHTGDRCLGNADGTFEYAGRVDDMFRFGGHWVDPAAVESVLNQHPSVAESAVVARADRNGVLVATAFVVPRAGRGAVPSRELRDYLGSRLAPHEVPRAITMVESLPKTPAGKIRRFMLAVREPPASIAG